MHTSSDGIIANTEEQYTQDDSPLGGFGIYHHSSWYTGGIHAQIRESTLQCGSALPIHGFLILIGDSYDKVAVGGREFKMSRKTGTPNGVAILDKDQWMKARYMEGEGLTLVPQANAVTVQAPTVRIRALFGSGSRNILAVIAMGVSG